jgi:hypothetical protein
VAGGWASVLSLSAAAALYLLMGKADAERSVRVLAFASGHAATGRHGHAHPERYHSLTDTGNRQNKISKHFNKTRRPYCLASGVLVLMLSAFERWRKMINASDKAASQR